MSIPTSIPWVASWNSNGVGGGGSIGSIDPVFFAL